MKVKVDGPTGFGDLLNRIPNVLPELRNIAEELLSSFGVNVNLSTFCEEVESLNVKQTVEIAKRYMAKGANAVAALRKQETDGTYVYLSYMKDGDLLPQSENKYVVIKTARFEDDVVSLFSQSDLVILK